MKDTLKKILRKELIFIGAVDVIFILLFGFVFDFIKTNVAAELENIIKIIGSASVEISPGIFEYSTLMQSLKQLPGFTGSLNTIIWNFFLLIVLVFILWVCLQSVSWWFAYKFNDKKVKFNSFFVKFLLKTIPYFVVLLAGLFLAVRIGIGITLTGDTAGAESAFAVFWGFVFVLLLLMYVNYGNIDAKLKKSVKNWRVVIAAAVMLFLVYLLELLSEVIGSISVIVMFIFGFIIIIPYLTYIRTFMVDRLR